MIAPLSRTRTGLLVVDVQDRLVAAMSTEVMPRIVRNIQLLIEAAHRFGMPILVSQQYPKGLGPTIQPIEDTLAGKSPHRFDKLEFSAGSGDRYARLARDQWLVCGMETHVCVFQTARGLLARGYDVHVVADASCSRTKRNWEIGLDLAERAGAIVTSTETCVFDLLGCAGTDEFKALSKLIK